MTADPSGRTPASTSAAAFPTAAPSAGPAARQVPAGVGARVPLSVLDLAQLSAGQSSGDALAATTALARRADDLGYERFWVAEHHGMAAVASTSPPVLMAHLAASTRRLRIGSGGVMLPNHAPLVVAEQFALLEALHPGRIDLGIGRAPGTDPVTAAALRRSPQALGAEDFPQQLLDVLTLLGDDRAASLGQVAPPGPRLSATPSPSGAPQVWLLGSSGYSARLAGLLGLPFCFAAHFGVPGPGAAAALEGYREAFQPLGDLPRPHAMVSAGVLAADDAAEAAFLARPGLLLRRALRTGRPITPLVSPTEAAAIDLGPEQEAALAAMPTGGVVGTREDVVAFLDDLVASTGADEVVVTSSTHGLDERLRTLDLIADAWGLLPQRVTA